MDTENLYVSHTPHVTNGMEFYQSLEPQQSVEHIYYYLTQANNDKIVMFISHNQPVIDLLSLISQHEVVEPYSIAMSEEVIGEPFHLESHEFKFQESGLIDILSKKGIPFYRILSRAPSLTGTIRIYSNRIAEIVSKDTVSHAFLEIRDDGSLSGIIPISSETEYLYSDGEDLGENIIIGYEKECREKNFHHVGLSLNTLRTMSYIWVFAFGENKKEYLKMLTNNLEVTPKHQPYQYLQELPGIVKIFTDQSVN